MSCLLIIHESHNNQTEIHGIHFQGTYCHILCLGTILWNVQNLNYLLRWECLIYFVIRLMHVFNSVTVQFKSLSIKFGLWHFKRNLQAQSGKMRHCAAKTKHTFYTRVIVVGEFLPTPSSHANLSRWVCANPLPVSLVKVQYILFLFQKLYNGEWVLLCKDHSILFVSLALNETLNLWTENTTTRFRQGTEKMYLTSSVFPTTITLLCVMKNWKWIWQ